MHVEYAQLPPPEDSADRIFITDNAVIVLDGATAFVPTDVSAKDYVDHLGPRLLDQLTGHQDVELSHAVATAIEQSATDLNLRSGVSPSSTVAILRKRTEVYDVLVLGDSAVVWGVGNRVSSLVDDRLDRVGVEYREKYRARLRAGHGYDDHHRRVLQSLQAEQRRHRNTQDGYWIAEADPSAAHEALLAEIPRADLDWVVLATDGAFDPLEHRDHKNWAQVAAYSGDELQALLRGLEAWERDFDHDGRRFPRAKQHDDKAIVVVRSRESKFPTDWAAQSTVVYRNDKRDRTADKIECESTDA